MNTSHLFPLPDPENSSVSPLAVISGELIHIIHPNGTVEITTTENIENNPTEHDLGTCIIWGRFEDF